MRMILSKNNTAIHKMKSGVRLYAPFTLKHAVRRWWILRNIGFMGEY